MVNHNIPASIPTLTPEQRHNALLIAFNVKWPVNVDKLEISVPHTDLELANKNIQVSKLIKMGFYIQTAIA